MTELKLALCQCKGEASGLFANIRISFKIFNEPLDIFIFIHSISWLNLAYVESVSVGRIKEDRGTGYLMLFPRSCFPRYFLETVLSSMPETMQFNHFSLRKRIPYHYEC